MMSTDLKELINELKANENGAAQDRVLLCEINSQLKNEQTVKHPRFVEAFNKYTWPHHDALVKPYNHSQDYLIVQSKRNLLHAWEALQGFLDFDIHKDSEDIHLKHMHLNKLYQLIEKGIFNLVLNTLELSNLKDMLAEYNDENKKLNGQDPQKIQNDYTNAIVFITSLK